MSRRELAIALLLFLGLLAPLIDIPLANAIFPQDQTILIDSTHNDKWTTGTGAIGIDSWLVHVTDPGYDVTSWVIFRNVSINNWEPLSPGNATLRLYTGNTLEFDKDSSITIYGMKVDELQNILPIGPSYAVSVPKTSAHVVFNTSQFYGPSKWWDINVTDIVEELIRAHNWDGDGLTGGDTGDAIGFVMLGARGHDVRYFVDYRSDPELSAQLRIRWNHQPPLDPAEENNVEFVEQYKNHSIWRKTNVTGYPILDPIDYVYRNVTGAKYLMYDTVEGIGPYIVEQNALDVLMFHPNQRKLIRTGNGTLYAVYQEDAVNTQIYIERSIDQGLTWINRTLISTYPGMDTRFQEKPSIAFDYNNTIYVAWQGQATGFELPQIWCVNYTTSWGTPVRISTYTGMQSYPQAHASIALDSQDNIYVVWGGKATGFITDAQIWCVNYTNSWGNPVRISTYTDMEDDLQGLPALALDSKNNVHVIWKGKALGFGAYQIWYVNHTTSWGYPFRISTYPGMNTNHQYRGSIAVDPSDYIHTVFFGKATDFTVATQIWYVNKTISWGIPIRISTYAGMIDHGQADPTIAVDLDYSLHVIFFGKATGLIDNEKVWYAFFTVTDSWSNPECLQPIGWNTYPSIRWSRFPAEPLNDTYFNTDLNGTLVQGPFDTLEEAIACLDAKEPIDPTDPDPIGWVTEGPFTRFKMRLYFLVIGYFCVWGPIWFMCWKRPSVFYIGVAFLIIIAGIGMLTQIPNV